jgi:glucan 1,3-beta-glucosidase
MKAIRTIAILLLALGAVAVQHQVQAVDKVVSNVLNNFGQYLGYSGNHSDLSSVSKRQSTPYWYETITHQGISAFGPHGYEVFRNVMDYGAKG